MTKNVKIDDEVHRLMSIRAARLGVHKSELSSVLLHLGLQSHDDIILAWIADAREPIKNQEYPSQDPQNDAPAHAPGSRPDES